MTIADVIAELDRMADAQLHLASDAYPQFTDSDRSGYRHAAAMLRLTANRLRVRLGLPWRMYE